MSGTKLYPGLPIILNLNQHESGQTLQCWVEQVRDDTALISAPMIGGNPVLLDDGARASLTFWDKVCAYTIEITITRRTSNPFPVYEIHLAQEFSRIQRRDYVRIDASFPVSFKVLVTDSTWSDWQKGVALDISGGGLRFNANRAVQGNCMLKLRFRVDTEEIDVDGRVLRVELADQDNGYTIAVQFVSLTKKARDSIIRYVFELQRLMRKKGLI